MKLIVQSSTFNPPNLSKASLKCVGNLSSAGAAEAARTEHLLDDHQPSLPLRPILRRAFTAIEGDSQQAWCVNQLSIAVTIPEENNLEEETIIMAPSFRGSSPWSAGSTALGLR